MSINGKLKSKKCQTCRISYTPWNSLQTVCSPLCALKQVELQRDKIAERDAKVARKARRERKQALKSKSDWLRETQAVFNKFIRLRDKDEPCISCGRFVHDNDLITGSRWDCGHYLTRGAFPELRFTEQNCAKQCSSCNGGSDKYTKKAHTVTQQYTENLIKKIGIVQFEWLKAKHEPLKLSIDDIRAVKTKYAQKCREMSANE